LRKHHPLIFSPRLNFKAMLEETREINARVGVTGSLLYKDGTFLQVLEGDQEAVMNLGRVASKSSKMPS
jgi:hypothetical protein